MIGNSGKATVFPCKYALPSFDSLSIPPAWGFHCTSSNGRSRFHQNKSIMSYRRRSVAPTDHWEASRWLFLLLGFLEDLGFGPGPCRACLSCPFLWLFLSTAQHGPAALLLGTKPDYSIQGEMEKARGILKRHRHSLKQLPGQIKLYLNLSSVFTPLPGSLSLS